MSSNVLMPKATAVWLIEETSLSFEQIAGFCELHPLEVSGIAAFLLVPSGRQIPEQELLAHCRSQLANYKIPKQFTMATVFPLLPIGKIDKQALRASPR